MRAWKVAEIPAAIALYEPNCTFQSTDALPAPPEAARPRCDAAFPELAGKLAAVT